MDISISLNRDCFAKRLCEVSSVHVSITPIQSDDDCPVIQRNRTCAGSTSWPQTILSALDFLLCSCLGLAQAFKIQMVFPHACDIICTMWDWAAGLSNPKIDGATLLSWWASLERICNRSLFLESQSRRWGRRNGSPCCSEKTWR